MNRLVNFSLHNRLLAFVLGLVVMAAGYWSYRALPVDAFPDVSPSLVQVFTETEGLAPEEVEKYVTYPVEVAMNGLPGVERIRSVSNFGLSVVNIYFEDGSDIYFARQLVNERLQEAREQIPALFGDPTLGPISTGMGLVLFYYLSDETGERSLTELRTIQDWFVKRQLQTVSGVTEVLGIGGYEKQFQVEVHPENLLRYGLTVGDVIERIRANNLNVGAQFIERNAEEIVVRSVGLAATEADLEGIVLRTEGGIPVYVRDVADVGVGGAVRRGLQTRDGVEEVVAGMVVKLYGENSSSVIERVEEKIEAINRSLPEGVRMVPYYEQKSLVEACIATVRSALVQGVAVVALVVFVFLGGIRPGLVVSLAIPFSVLFAALWMGYLGMSANLMSLGGLAIAVGMLVDGAIVIVENVDRRLRSGEGAGSKLRVVSEACGEVVRPIAFATMIVVTVFAPLFTLQGVEGKTFRPLAYTVALAMLGALVFALVLAPGLASVLLKTRTASPAQGAGGMERMVRGYRRLLAVFVARRWLAGALAAGLLLLGAALLPLLGSEFTPRLQEGTLVVRLTMAPSISLQESQRVTQIVERRLVKIPEIAGVVSRIGRGEVGAHADPVNSAEMYVLLRPKEEWRASTQEELGGVIRERLGRVPGVLVNFTQPIAMTVDELLEGVRAELAIKVFGEDLDLLKSTAEEVSRAVSTVRGAADVQVDQVSGTPQLIIRVNRNAVARYGINVKDVQATIRASIGGEVAGEVFEGVRRFDILVRFAPEYRETVESIRDLIVAGPSGLRVPLSELASFEEVVGPRQITREDNQRFVTVQSNVLGRDIGSFVEEARAVVERSVDLPPGYIVTWGGQFRLQQEANRRLAVVVPVTLMAVLLLLYASFQSWKNAFLILLNIPLALVGGIAALAVTGQNLSVPASVGFIALFGIALGNGMVLVSAINQLMATGLGTRQASIDGASLRLRAVLMTAATTALGLMPLLLSTGVGSEVQRPLATVVVGGLLTSTVVTLLFLPAFYEWFAATPGPEETHG
ncbi:MAG: efflux RND transporter permease subunit [Deltaproteobacteria bacterium]|nr:efflux RND transporter permease subunit [Deltaproteobacteria bacterium]MBW2664933.1 efflux RND transporter permease subunit [Deltaproteobacteria bacterium]